MTRTPQRKTIRGLGPTFGFDSHENTLVQGRSICHVLLWWDMAVSFQYVLSEEGIRAPVDLGWHASLTRIGKTWHLIFGPNSEEIREMGWPYTGTFMDTCKYFDGEPCYYDGSTVVADHFIGILELNGEERMWEAMQGYGEEIRERLW